MHSAFSLPSYAKINWNLRILGRRNDGFHELCTVFQTVSLHDTLSFDRDDGLSLTCDDPKIPTDERNLVIMAANRLRERFQTQSGAKIHLEKRIPSPGGLGGGSSNAAVALLGLAKLWQLDFEPTDLRQIAEGLGSDVPFFLYGGTALGTGRGEQLTPMEDRDEKFVIVVTPDVAISTQSAFADIGVASLTTEALNRILRVCRLEAKSLNLHQSVLINDFEASVFSAYPEIRRVKETLLTLGAIQAQMSGSGSSVFAIFDKEETRQTALKALDREVTWRKFAVATISRNEYREALTC